MTTKENKKVIHKIINTKKLDNSEVEIECEIGHEEVVCYRSKAIESLQKELNLPGFRPGHVPENMIIQHIGEQGLLAEMAELAINDSYSNIIVESKQNFISMPDVQITKIAIGNPINFKISGQVMPEVELTDYKKIAKSENGKKEESTEVTEKEIAETIEQIRTNYAQRNHTHAEGEKHKEGEKLDLPEINDEFVTKLGDFKDVADFNIKLKEGLQKEKEFKAKDKKRLAIIEEIINKSKITLPKLLVDSELQKMQAQFTDDIARVGLKVEDYLKHIKKTWEDLKKEWLPDAEKRAKLQLILSKIALDEKIEPEKSVVDKEVEQLMKTYKDAKEDRTRAYVEMVLTNEKVFEYLENIK